MSRGRVVGLVAVGLVHVLLGYALITGLATRAVKLITDPMKTVNIKEEVKPPEEPPPPPPKDVEIPPFVPPPEVTVQSDTPPPVTIQTQNVAPQPPVAYTPPAPVAAPPAPPPAPTGPTSAASFNPRSLEVSEDDYPPSSLRAEEQGVVRVSVNIDATGKVIACSVTASSNFPKLDEKTCQIAMRRWKGKPALQNGTPVPSTLVKAVRWQVNTK